MKRTLLLILFTLVVQVGFSQCSIEPYSLAKRVDMAHLIVEGKVVQKKAMWNPNENFIYTLNTIELYKAFKGIPQGKQIEVITEGGQIDLTMITANPTLELSIGDAGLFLLNENNLLLKGETKVSNRYMGVASVQSFIEYDLDEQKAYDFSHAFKNIKNDLYGTLTDLTGEPIRNIIDAELDPWFGKIRPLATPTISSFSDDTATAGTGFLLTINGNNFGFAPGDGGVGFIDANFGDGRYFFPEFNTSYKSWSNTKIEVYIPSRAGTGKVKVTNAAAESGTSSKNIYIKYAHLNSTYGSATVDTQYFQTDHIDDNGKGGYTWQMHNSFKARTTAVNAFMRALENWRCATLMNWDVGNETSVNAIARDNINLVRLTRFGDSRLGVCYSYWSGCGSGSNLTWYVSELDIEFDSTKNWYYGTGTPSGSQMDFESVATHELGHGHQMGHVNDSKKIMHYSIGNGQRKTTLTAEDLEGGNALMDRSVQNNACGPNKLVALAQNKCTITKPRADFASSATTACPKEDITFTDKSEGIISTYFWDFGDGASSATATGIGPHTINYATSGSKTVRLIVTNSFGTDTSDFTLMVNVATPAKPVALPYMDSTCVGQQVYRINKVEGAESYLWLLSGGGSIVGTNTDTFLTVNWLTSGSTFDVKAVALNTCGNSGTLVLPVKVFAKATVGFTELAVGRMVTFTNVSTHATQYKWYFGDGDSATNASPTHNYTTAGSYDVTLIASNFCSSQETTKNVKVNFGASVKDFAYSGLYVYPNPAQEKWIVNNTYAQAAQLQVLLYDVNGKLLHTYVFEHKEAHIIDISGLKPGVYIASFAMNEQFLGTQRLMKE